MVVGFTEHSRQYWQLQMAARLAVQNKKPVITRERELFSDIAIFKPSEFSEDLSGKLILSHERRTLVLDR